MAQLPSPNRATVTVASRADEATVAAALRAEGEAPFRIGRIGARAKTGAMRLGGGFGGAT